MSLRQEKGVNVQVLLRCRPFSSDELKNDAPQVVTCNEYQREVTVSQSIAGKQIDRVFTFDKVFGPTAQQKDLYEQAVIPIVNEVLEGFNCTIFAYGQIGTGKTYTMEGECKRSKSGPNGELPMKAGVIPRSVKHIFDTLEGHPEYSVKVTFIELYNEEITDLLAPVVVEDKQKKLLPLMEDGKGGVIVRGLKEEIVTKASEIFTLLERGSAKRQTTETLLNKQSSRSHSLFSVTIQIKDTTPEGEELIKCGKLDFVDLAGSENISRSGAREGRAREAGEINKSLHTLGRVINALVEHSGHIPYRDSKLTRLLCDSLGGRTKTCMIATITPDVNCLEETLSTLDYAHRAKNIKNKPEVNQKRMLKTTQIEDLYGEIEGLKAEVLASREKSGVYLPKERYDQEEMERKSMADEIESKQKVIEEVQTQLDARVEEFSIFVNPLYAAREDKLNGSVVNKFGAELAQDAHNMLVASVSQLHQQFDCTNKNFHTFINIKEKAFGEFKKKVSSFDSSNAKSVEDLLAANARIQAQVDGHQGTVSTLLGGISRLFEGALKRAIDSSQRTTNIFQRINGYEDELNAGNRSEFEAEVAASVSQQHQLLEWVDDICHNLICTNEIINDEINFLNGYSTFE